MKNHSRRLLWKRSQLLAQSRRWTAGFGEPGKSCFQRQFFLAKQTRPSTQLIVSPDHSKLCRGLHCRRRALGLRGRWAPRVPVDAESYQKPAEPHSFPYRATESKKVPSLFLKSVLPWGVGCWLGTGRWMLLLGRNGELGGFLTCLCFDFSGIFKGFLDDVMKKYGSLVPLCEKDVMGRLKEVFNEDFSHRKPFITREIMKYREKHPKTSTCNFRVFYNKHMLDMDDLATLEGQNWLNDQIINMYGELIMDAVPEKVHFFNSFFHRQLVTKGYNGVKRWTKKVDLFKKTLLLIPIHLEVHWSLITVNIPNRIISFYDSQGIHFKFCVENIRKYLLTEAKEKNCPEFLQGWQTAVTKCIPQQKNDSDCGVFVLQYCKCLALDQPFQFSQEDMPRVRKRIYKELCERQLID
uniref:SUMO specific peptidase 5 n=1 Tax=Calidris pygmaea TaxID=425635 RepID=A0A8C3KDM4_9CHAR